MGNSKPDAVAAPLEDPALATSVGNEVSLCVRFGVSQTGARTCDETPDSVSRVKLARLAPGQLLHGL